MVDLIGPEASLAVVVQRQVQRGHRLYRSSAPLKSPPQIQSLNGTLILAFELLELLM